jgi:hypothetical protein
MFVQGVECYEGSRSSDTSTIYVSNTVKFVMSNDCFLKGIQKISKQNNNNGIPLHMYQLINKIQLYLVPLYLSVLLNFIKVK